MQLQVILFIDASVNPKTKVGVGAYLALSPTSLMTDDQDFDRQIRHQVLPQTSSTKAELQTCLWAIRETVQANKQLTSLQLYSDSQCLVGLPSRRNKLESKNFTSAKSGKVLQQAALYRDFYQLCDQFPITVTKLDGHMPSSQHDHLQSLFALVDRHTRRQLRQLNSSDT